MIYSKVKEKLFNLFRKEKTKNKEDIFKDNKFKEYLFFLEDSEQDKSLISAIELCNNNLKLEKHKLYLKRKIKNYEKTLEDINCYNKLSNEEANRLKSLINKFIQIDKERISLRNQLNRFNSSINKLDFLEEDAKDAISQIELSEEEERILSRDLEIIKQEQERTKQDRKNLELSYKIVYYISIVMSILFSLSIILISFSSLFKNRSVFKSLTITFFIIVFIVSIVYILIRKIKFELKLNEKKQAKIVNLLNKKTVVYSYYLNYLNFSYNKYGVKNSRVLKNNLLKYSEYKNIINKYDKLGKILFETQKKLEEFLSEKSITITNPSLESFAKSINIDNKISFAKSIKDKKLENMKKLKNIEDEQQEIWDNLVELNKKDESKEKVIEKIMNSYLKEVENIYMESTFNLNSKKIDNIDNDKNNN